MTILYSKKFRFFLTGFLVLFTIFYFYLLNPKLIEVKSQGRSQSANECPLIDSYAVWFVDDNAKQKYLAGTQNTNFYVTSTSQQGFLYGFGGTATIAFGPNNLPYRMTVHGNLLVKGPGKKGVYAEQFCLINEQGATTSCSDSWVGGGGERESRSSYWKISGSTLYPSSTNWNVAIATTSIPSGFDLYVKGTTSVSVLCFNGTNCRTGWGSGGGSDYWLLNTNNGNLYPSSTNWNVGVALPQNATVYSKFQIGGGEPGSPIINFFLPSATSSFPYRFGSVNYFLRFGNENYLSQRYQHNLGGDKLMIGPAYRVKEGEEGYPIGIFHYSTSTEGVIMTIDFTKWNVGIGTTSPYDSYRFHVVGNARFEDSICLKGSCINTWPDKDIIVTFFELTNGVYYPATSHWYVLPVNDTPFIRDGNFDNLPYLKASDLINKYALEGATTTKWFDLAYGFYNINAPQNKAIFMEEGDNARPFAYFSTTTDLSSNSRYIFVSMFYYDANGIFRTTTTDISSSLTGGFCPNGGSNCIFRKNYVDKENYIGEINLQGYLKLELRAVPWQKPPGTPENYCLENNKNYAFNIKIARWARPLMVSLTIGRFKSPPSNDNCAGANLGVKIQGRLVNDRYPDRSNTPSPTTLSDLLSYLSNPNNDFYFVFKKLGIAYTSKVQVQ